MKKYLIFAMSACFFACMYAVGAAFSVEGESATEMKPVAIVIKAFGEAGLLRGGEKLAVEGGLPLMPGDKITMTMADSFVLVLFSNGKTMKVISDYEISEADATSGGGETPAVERAAAMLIGSTTSSDLEAASGTLRAADAPAVRIVSFLETKTTVDRPVFRWETSPPAEKSKIVLMNAAGDELWISETKGNEAAYPDDLVLLPAGEGYRFVVTSTIGGREENAESKFHIIGKEEAERVGKEVDAIKKEYSGEGDAEILHLLLAQYYKGEGLYMGAESELKQLIALDEGAIFPRRELAAIYLLTGNRMYAVREMEKTKQTVFP